MMRTMHPIFQPGRRRRGSVFVLIMTLLVVIALIAMTLGFSTQSELMAAHNWSSLVQARVAADKGKQLFAPLEKHPIERTTDTLKRPDTGLIGEGADAARHETGVRGDRMTHYVPLKLTRAEAEPETLKGTSPEAAADPIPPVSRRMPLAASVVEDLSARLNINAFIPSQLAEASARSDEGFRLPALDETVLERFIRSRFRAEQIEGPDPGRIAREIVWRRLGPDRKLGRAIEDEDTESMLLEAGRRPQTYRVDEQGRIRAGRQARHASVTPRRGDIRPEVTGGTSEKAVRVDMAAADVRTSPPGDDEPFGHLRELMAIPGMTLEAYHALEPFLTVFSVSAAAYELPATSLTGPAENEGWPQVDPNTASPHVIFEALRCRFPEAPDALLAQFAVNVVDRRDGDDVPSAFELDGRTYYGVERVPVVNEVCSDAPSFEEEGDDGQFIELTNPYEVEIDLSGWVLDVAGQYIPLEGILPGGGYLVITDDFNNRNDPTPERGVDRGSFYQAFGKVGTGLHRRIEEYVHLDIPDAKGSIRLLNIDGEEVDRFDYEEGRWDGATMSLQRIDPRLRHHERMLATPLEANRQTPSNPVDGTLTRIQAARQNQPFASALEVMLLSAAYAGPGGGANGEPGVKAWAIPVLEAESSTQLDIRLVDCFSVAMDHRGGGGQRVASPSAGSRGTVRYGRINLNTASLGVLAALPGMDKQILEGIHQARREAAAVLKESVVPAGDEQTAMPQPFEEAYWQALGPDDPVCWPNLSDFLRDARVWGETGLYQRLEQAFDFVHYLSTHSLSLQVVSVNYEERTNDAKQILQRPSLVRVRQIITADRGRIEALGFEYAPNDRPGRGDPDMRYAVGSRPRNTRTLERKNGDERIPSPAQADVLPPH